MIRWKKSSLRKDNGGGNSIPEWEMTMKAGVFAVSAILASAMLLMCVMVSSVATVPPDKTTASGSQTQRPGLLSMNSVVGFVYEADGTTPVTGAAVIVTNLNTGASGSTLTDIFGYYSVDVGELPGGVALDDIINVTATKNLKIGWNEGAFSWDVTFLDITLSSVILEFPSLVVPVLGSVCVVVVSRRKSKGV
jgi:hypothetical protein